MLTELNSRHAVMYYASVRDYSMNSTPDAVGSIKCSCDQTQAGMQVGLVRVHESSNIDTY